MVHYSNSPMKEIQAATLLWRTSPAHLVLPAGETHVFSFALDLPASQVAGLARILSHDEVARAERFKLARDRLRYISGRAQLRMILGRYVDGEAARLEFRYGSHGKPALQRGSGGERVRFNMSRSHGLGILAIQLDEDIGIDVERVRLLPDALRIAKRLFAAEEHRALRSLPASELGAAFFRYWTRKEAVVKSIGLGLSYPVNAFTLSFKPGASPERIVAKSKEGNARRWLIPVPELSPGYVAALATAGSPSPLKCWTWVDR